MRKKSIWPTRTEWQGEFVSQHLGLSINNEPGQTLDIEDVVGLAVRNNPKRAHLLVSKVLGKHIPASPAEIITAGQLLGAKASIALGGVLPSLTHIEEALRESVKHGGVDIPAVPLPNDTAVPTVVGYAETATSLGHIVAEYLDAPYIHSTRYGREDAVEYGTFEEAHSHATTHKLLPENPDMLNNSRPLILVDDEMSTGKTIIATIEQLNALSHRKHYVVCSLIDCRTAADKANMQAFAESIGATIDVVALSHGEVTYPSDILVKASDLIRKKMSSTETYDVYFHYPKTEVSVHTADLSDYKHSRYGLEDPSLGNLPVKISDIVEKALNGAKGRTVVLGLEEFMYLPLQVAAELENRDMDVYSSSTTRSPVITMNRDDYAIRISSNFTGADGSPRFAYNLMNMDNCVIIVEPGSDKQELLKKHGLIRAMDKTYIENVIIIEGETPNAS